MSKLKLDITLVSVTGVKHGETIAAMRKCMDKVDFADVVLLTNIDLELPDIKCINVGGLDSIEAYSKFIIRELYKYFQTSHCLICQHDSWILNPECWEAEFLEYDIVGAAGLHVDGRQNLNGGFSLRSRYFQKVIALDDAIDIFHPCDEVLCRLYRLYLIKKYSIKYAPDEVAERFSYELRQQYCKSFGFHNFHLQPFREHVLIIRKASLGDVIMVQPIIEYYHQKGYQVVLDTLPQFMNIFNDNPYKIKHISEMHPLIKPIKVINLDGAYEAKPKQSVLTSYYEFSGISDGLLVNSKLYVNADKKDALFQKYILIHCDDTSMNYRNANGINWGFVVNYYHQKGWAVFQIGKRTKDIVATHVNTATLEMLKYVIRFADCLIGIDSSPAQIAVALDTPAAIFFGSVNPAMRYQNFDKIVPIHSPCFKEADDYCYHQESNSEVGRDCKYNKDAPSCAQYTEYQVIGAVNKLLKL